MLALLGAAVAYLLGTVEYVWHQMNMAIAPGLGWGYPLGMNVGTLFINAWWLVAILAAFPAAWLVDKLIMRRGRLARAKLPLCRNCHYDLTGNVSGVCPECGSTIAKSAGVA